MALVALQFEHDQVLVASARVSGKRIQIHDLFAIDLLQDDGSTAEKLKAELQKHGLVRADAILVVSRANAEMRELTVPPAPDSELPEMVRFIARSEFATLNENWVLDYVPMSSTASESRTVLAAGISPELQKQMKALCEPSGLKVKHIVLRPFAALDLLRSQLSDGKCRLVVDPNGDQTDMTIVDGDQLIATRTVRIPASYDADQRSKTLLSEIRRMIASSRKMLGDRAVSDVMLFGDQAEHQVLEGNLQSQLDVSVEFVQPLKIAPARAGLKQPEHGERFAGLMGALVQQNSKLPHTLDFVNPRRPIVKKNDMTRWYMYSGIAAAAALAAIVFGWWTLNSQATEIAQMEQEHRELVELNAGGNGAPSVAQIVGEVGKIDQWKIGDVNWLDELYEFSDRALTPDNSIVDLFDAETNLRTADPKIMINTRIADVQDESDLIASLNERPYRIENNGSGFDGNEEADYPWISSLQMMLIQDPQEILKELDEKATEYITKRNSGLNTVPPKAD